MPCRSWVKSVVLRFCVFVMATTFTSNRNSLKLSDRGYSYVFHKTYKSGMAVWRCSRYRYGECKATVKTEARGSTRIIDRKHTHSCAYQPELVEVLFNILIYLLLYSYIIGHYPKNNPLTCGCDCNTTYAPN